jgi:hypothetical protein
LKIQVGDFEKEVQSLRE